MERFVGGSELSKSSSPSHAVIAGIEPLSIRRVKSRVLFG